MVNWAGIRGTRALLFRRAAHPIANGVATSSTMAPSPAASGGDLFLTRKGKLSRGRGKASPERWAPPVPLTERQQADAARLTEDRREVILTTLANEGFEIVFQPIVDLRSGGVVGAEALTRFGTGAGTARPPDAWFAEAKEVGLGVELETAAIRSALDQLHRLPSGLYLSLNASPDTMMSEEFRAAVASAPAERVVLELTEHDSIDDYDLFEKIASELRSHGARLAIDDAGAGYSSLRHIINLHPDIIKLDIGLTRGIDGDPARRALGSAMLAFGLNAFDASIVAEGIETEGEFKTLRGLGYQFGQGFYLGRPGRLRLPRPQPDSVEHLWLGHRSETQPLPVPDPIQPDQGTRPEPLLRAHAGGPSIPPAEGEPGHPKREREHVFLRHGPHRDTRDELLALVAETQTPQEDDRHEWNGDRSRVRVAGQR
jgi:EAL domain-containing protein (putative c-di-GMP-specific phosphodiesterase class I)